MAPFGRIRSLRAGSRTKVVTFHTLRSARRLWMTENCRLWAGVVRCRAMRTIRIWVLFAVAAFPASAYLAAQSAAASASSMKNPPEFDHTTVYVRDLGKSVEFY